MENALRLSPKPNHALISLGETNVVQDDRDDLSQDDRRQFDRSRFILDVHFDGGEATGVASTKDMSLGGLYMNTQAEIPEDATLTLRIPIADQYVVVKADVVYVNPGR